MTAARPWCACFQTYEPDPRLCEAHRCIHRYPSTHPELWVDLVHDHCHQGDA